jgi:peptidoglycan/LPS O-acetylase OafA/YrhL
MLRPIQESTAEPAQKNDKLKRRQIIELQSIRGIAAALVMVGHALNYFDWSGRIPAAIPFLNGRAAVGMFFVLSGYVLTHMLRGKSLSIDGQIAFWIRRVLRIYPALLVATLFGVAVIASKPMIGFPHGGEFVQHHFDPSRLRPVFLVLAFAGLSAHVLSPVWTISVELVGSAMIGFFVGLRAKYFVSLLFLTILLGFTFGPSTPYSTLMYMPFFLMGASIWRFADMWRLALHRMPLQKTVILLAAVMLVALRGCFDLPYNDPKLAFVEMTMATLIIALLVHGGVDVPFLRHPFLVWVGDISYSSYLLHITVFLLVGSAVGHLVTGSNPIADNLLVMALTVAGTLPLSWLCYRYVELPGIELGRRLSRLPARGGATRVASTSSGLP